MCNFVEEKTLQILRETKIFIQLDQNTIHNQAMLVVYVRFIHEDNIREEMLFIKNLHETTCREDIYNEIMEYLMIKTFH